MRVRPTTVLHVSLLLFLGVALGCGEPANRAVTSLEAAVAQLERGVTSFEELTGILNGVKTNLDDEVYKNQIDELIGRTGQVAQLSVEGSVDFVRVRVAEDLTNIKRQLLGQEPLDRVPVLSNPQSVKIDFKNDARTTVTIVGWNLDVAANDPSKYPVVIETTKPGESAVERTVPIAFVPYHGQYAVSLNVSSSGVPLEHYDSRAIFKGYVQPFSLAIVNSTPDPPPPHITHVRVTMHTTDNDLDEKSHLTFCVVPSSFSTSTPDNQPRDGIPPDEQIGEPITIGINNIIPDGDMRTFAVTIRNGKSFTWDERLGYGLFVAYNNSEGKDPNWIGNLSAEAVLSNAEVKPVLINTGDFELGHHDNKTKVDRVVRVFIFN